MFSFHRLEPLVQPPLPGTLSTCCPPEISTMRAMVTALKDRTELTPVDLYGIKAVGLRQEKVLQNDAGLDISVATLEDMWRLEKTAEPQRRGLEEDLPGPALEAMGKEMARLQGDVEMPTDAGEVAALQGAATVTPKSPQQAETAQAAQGELDRIGQVRRHLVEEADGARRGRLYADLNTARRGPEEQEQPEVGPITSHSEGHYL